mgnify:CR=1 FL=1
MKTKILKLFEKYYNHEMSELEKEQFGKSLENDPDMNAQYKEYLSIYEAIGDKESLDLRIKIKEITESHGREGNISDFLKNGYNWLWMAALVTILVCITTIVYLFFNRIEKREKFLTGVYHEVYFPSGNLGRELAKFEQRNVGLEVYAPGDTIFFNKNEPIYFNWHLGFDEPLILDLINQQGRIIYTSGKPVLCPHVVNVPLQEGLVVYRLRTEKVFYHMGFIYLR